MYCLILIFACAKLLNGLQVIEADPPQPKNHALVARHVIHNCEWVALSSISTIPEIRSFPFAGLESIVDGINDKGNGVPYFFVTSKDQSIMDVNADNRCSVIASLAELSWCRDNNLDQEDPRCARVTLTGNFVMVDNTTEEHAMALNNMFTKHPLFKFWPNGHNFDIAKLDIKFVTLFDWFGGLKTIDLTDYFNANDYNFV